MDIQDQDPVPNKDDIPKKNDGLDSSSGDNADGKTNPDSGPTNFNANLQNGGNSFQAAGDIHIHYHEAENKSLDKNLEQAKQFHKDKEERNRDQQTKESQNLEANKTENTLLSEKYLPNDGIVWFSQKSLKIQAFIIAQLFFPDSSLQFLDEMSNEIVRLLNKGKVIQPEQRTSMFDQDFSIQNLIDEGIVNSVSTKVETDAGKLVVDVVAIVDSKVYDRLIQLVLTNYDFVRIHPLIRLWLVKQIEKNNQDLYSVGAFDADVVKMQAALGLGILARHDFSIILSSTIGTWAGAENPNMRLLVGWVLLGYYQEEKSKEYWSAISSLLGTWVSVGNYFTRWTAIASTTRLGLIYSLEDDTSLNVSLSVYKEISKLNLNQIKNFKGVLNKCIKFLFSLSPYHARIICNELASWLKEDKDSNLVNVASELFIEIVNTKIRTDANDSNKKDITLWELCENESYVLSDSIVQLIRQSLLHPRGKFVDRAVNEMHISVEEFLSNDLVQYKALNSILKQLNSDKSLSKYISLMLDKKHVFLIS